MDVKGVLLNGKLTEDFYMEKLIKCKVLNKNLIYKFKKAIYGLN
jgi:hypothetical protein